MATQSIFVFTTDRSLTVVLILFVWPCGRSLPGFFFFLSFPCSLFYCFVDPVEQYDHLIRDEGAGCFDFLWFVACVLSVCLHYQLVSLVG